MSINIPELILMNDKNIHLQFLTVLISSKYNDNLSL